VLAGNFNSNAEERGGRATNAPPQLGHAPPKRLFAHASQKVHSNEQIIAPV
jgi:hypothetical protein